MSELWKIFLRGLAAILPVAITISILYWIGVSLESVLGGIFQLFIPEKYYLPGTGLIIALVLIFVLGATVQAWLISTLIRFGERMIKRIPVAKTIYGGVRDLMRFISATSERENLDQVVMLEIAKDMQVVGFVTGQGVSLGGGGDKGDVATVYLPMSYQLGGYTVCVPRSRLKVLDTPVETAMRWVITAGVSTDEE